MGLHILIGQGSKKRRNININGATTSNNSKTKAESAINKSKTKVEPTTTTNSVTKAELQSKCIIPCT